MSTSMDDDDAPPELVDVSTLSALEKPRSSLSTAAAVDTPPHARVPITLVTGMLNALHLDEHELTNILIRLSGRGKNHFTQLYSH